MLQDDCSRGALQPDATETALSADASDAPSALLVRARTRRSAHPVALIILIAWVANYLHFTSFGFYEDDWYFFAKPYQTPTSLWFAQMLAAMVHFFVGRPLMTLYLYVSAYLGAALSSIQFLYVVAFAFLALSVTLMHSVLRQRFPALFSNLACVLFVLSPLITFKQFLNGELIVGPAFICLFFAILAYSRRRNIPAYLLAALVLMTYESLFFLFLAAPLFQKRRDKARLRAFGAHFTIWACLLGVYLFVRHLSAEARLANISEGPARTLVNVVLYDLFFTVSSVKPYLYAMYVGVREISLEAVLYCAFVFVPVMVMLLRSSGTLWTMRPLGGGKVSAARCRWWIQNGILGGIFVTLLGYAVAYFTLNRDWLFPLTGRDTRASIAASFGHSILIAALIILIMQALRRPALRASAFVAVIAGLSALFLYSFVVQQDYVKDWMDQRNFITQMITLSPDVDPDTLFIVRSTWVNEHLFPNAQRKLSIGSQKHGIEVSIRSMFGWDTAPKILFVYTDDWKTHLAMGSGKLLWTDKNFPGGWSPTTSDPVTPGHIILLEEHPNGLLSRLDTPVLVANVQVVKMPPLLDGKPQSQWEDMSPSPLFQMVVPAFVSAVVMVPGVEKSVHISHSGQTALVARIAVRFPAVEVPDPSGLGYPLIVTGREGAGDVISVRYFGHNTLRVHIDHWGLAPVESDLMQYDPTKTYFADIFIGDHIAGGIGSIRAFVRARAFPTTQAQVVVGGNPIGGGTTKEKFNGEIAASELNIP